MENAELYIVRNTFPRYLAANILEEYWPQLSWREDENVLDIGCGPGDVSTQILLPKLPRNASLVGVDINSKLIKFAQENYGNEKIFFKTIDFATKDINKHLPERGFSKLFSFSCLHWIKDQRQMAHNLFTLLQPGGELLAVMIPSSEFYMALRQLSDLDQFKKYCHDVEGAVPPPHYSCDGLKEKLTAEGFDVVTCERRSSPFVYPSLEFVTTSFEAVNPFVKWMPEDVKEKYLEAFKQIVSRPSSTPRILPTGEVRMLHETIVIFARRPR